jgi:hypothetical protein
LTGLTGIDDNNVNLSHLLASLLDNLVYDLALLTGTSVNVDGDAVLFGNRLDSIGSILGSVSNDDGRAGYIHQSCRINTTRDQ